MSRAQPYTSATVDATLTGKHIYHVKIVLSLFEFLGLEGVLEHEVEQETLLPGTAIDDGDYLMRYSFEDRDFTVNRRVTGGGRFLKHA